MALTGLEIFKLLPNKNCNECGVPTCLAFAMKLAAKSAEPTLCPYISEKSLDILGASQSPPIKKLNFKLNDNSYEMGAETVLYRHEKTFLNKTLIALEVSDKLSDTEFSNKINEINSYVFERVGEKLECESISLLNETDNKENYLNKFKNLQKLNKILILSNIKVDYLSDILQIENNHSRLIINSINKQEFDSYINLVNDKEIKIVLYSETLNELFELVQKAENKGIKNILLKTGSQSLSKLLNDNIALRRFAIKKNFKPSGYPILTETNDEINSSIIGICKYTSLLILKKYNGATLFPLLTLRQNIYTDPQKPLQIQPGIYNIGEPKKESPLLVTTNFSLTYFIVSGEIENSGTSAWLVVPECEGMSVLTAWAAGKFSGAHIAKFIKEIKLEDQIKTREIIIPGYVAQISGELEEALNGWTVKVGPQEASDIESYVKARKH